MENQNFKLFAAYLSGYIVSYIKREEELGNMITKQMVLDEIKAFDWEAALASQHLRRAPDA